MKRQTMLKLMVMVGVLGLWAGAPVVAQSNGSAAISQGFQTHDNNLRAGALVSFERGNNDRVELANRESAEQLIGVVGEKPLVALSASASETQVVTQGVAPVLVSTINGDVKSGDKITASPINGVGMKATASSVVIGTAREDLSAKPTQEVTVTDTDKHTKQVQIGTISAQINITYFAGTETAQSFLPPFLQQMANSIAGREVPVLRVVMGLLLLIAGFIGAGILLYSSVQSSIISIGRNPLSEGAVNKSLLRVGLIAAVVLLTATAAVYLVFTL
ncbi:MAG TPA: hypothetical protein VFZ58_04695 [Candidatus Saccharimonadales bacterium]